ncbi:MAG: SAM-dependent methyltransferase [Psychromonas sp.]|jgi:SAM-dependent methyltransferase|uniref:class I SAM-dependent methyltransferase n=1 Tax=Psychromonas sp. TaxID=1884585 RepID=UPI0039E56E55
MRTAKTSRLLPPLSSWQQLPNGESLHQQTQQRIDDYLEQCFGYNLLKLGHLSCQINTFNSRIPHQINCASSGDNITLQADINQLPLQNSTIDLCILTHELDFSSDPHQLLREIDRVLALDGTLIISGYNPISLFGLRTALHPKNPKNARLFLPNRVIDWLHLLGFKIQQKQHFDFLSHNLKSTCSLFIEDFGQRYLPYFCSVYFIIAKKKTIPMTPIKYPFKFKGKMVTGQAVATRTSPCNQHPPE